MGLFGRDCDWKDFSLLGRGYEQRSATSVGSDRWADNCAKTCAGRLNARTGGRKIGIGLGAVARVEQGTAVPTIIRLIELAELFGCRFEELLSGVPATLDDRAAMIARTIAQLKPVDQAIVVEVVTTLVQRFKEG
nr:helix-turn-helix transcriptional regulator [Burkholderia ambifaria]